MCFWSGYLLLPADAEIKAGMYIPYLPFFFPFHFISSLCFQLNFLTLFFSFFFWSMSVSLWLVMPRGMDGLHQAVSSCDNTLCSGRD
jgi:hypothetical protein